MKEPLPAAVTLIDRLRELERAATPGPWNLKREPLLVDKPADLVLIAAMRNALPALLDVVEAAQEFRYGTRPGNDFWAPENLWEALDNLLPVPQEDLS